MNLPKTPPSYDAANEAQARSAIVQADRDNRKVGQDIDLKNARLFEYDTVTGARYQIVVTNGVLALVAS